jgi:hypothetical protein
MAKCMESQGAVAHGSAARISGTARAPVASRASEIIFVGTVVNIVGYGRGFKRRFLRGRVAVPRCSSQHFRLLLSASSRRYTCPCCLIANLLCPCTALLAGLSSALW